jgi:ribose 5-phosphate isomerase B
MNELAKRGHEVVDCGCYDANEVDYPDVAAKVAQGIQKKEFQKGFLVCGTGIGMQICANKFSGVYAAVCHDLFSTDRSVYANNINIMCIGALVVGKMTALKMAEEWLARTYESKEPFITKLGKLYAYEQENMK